MNIALIDNHTLFRDGVTALLARYKISVTSFESGKQALAQLSNISPDIVLLDIRMPEMSGIEVLIALKQQKITQAPIVMLTTSTDEQDIRQCLQNGASGYLLKDMKPEELVNALTDTLQGKMVTANNITPILAKILTNELNEVETFQKLTKREKEVACLIMSGLNNKLIARSLNISDGTVKLHVKSILKKLKLQSRVEVAVMMVEGNFCSRNTK